MITRINANTNTTARKNNPNFKMRFSQEEINYLAAGNGARGSKLITCTAMGAYTRHENESIVKNLLEKHPDNGMIRRIAQILKIIPDPKAKN